MMTMAHLMLLMMYWGVAFLRHWSCLLYHLIFDLYTCT